MISFKEKRISLKIEMDFSQRELDFSERREDLYQRRADFYSRSLTVLVHRSQRERGGKFLSKVGTQRVIRIYANPADISWLNFGLCNAQTCKDLKLLCPWCIGMSRVAHGRIYLNRVVWATYSCSQVLNLNLNLDLNQDQRCMSNLWLHYPVSNLNFHSCTQIKRLALIIHGRN